MKKFFQLSKGSSLLVAVITLVLGLILVIFPGTATTTLCRILGWALIAVAIVMAVFYLKDRSNKGNGAEPATFKSLLPIIVAVIALTLGLWLVIAPGFWVRFLFIIFGLLLLYHGFMDANSAIAMKKSGMEKWWIYMILAAITIVLGLIVVIAPFMTMSFVVVLCGIALIYDAISELIIIFSADKAVQK